MNTEQEMYPASEKEREGLIEWYKNHSNVELHDAAINTLVAICPPEQYGEDENCEALQDLIRVMFYRLQELEHQKPAPTSEVMSLEELLKPFRLYKLGWEELPTEKVTWMGAVEAGAKYAQQFKDKVAALEQERDAVLKEKDLMNRELDLAHQCLTELYEVDEAYKTVQKYLRKIDKLKALQPTDNDL